MKVSNMSLTSLFPSLVFFIIFLSVSAHGTAPTEANTIQTTITDAATVKALSNGIYDTTKKINLPYLRRMLNEGQQGAEGEGEGENQDEEEEEMDMESSSEINIEAHEDGSVTISITSYNPEFVMGYLGLYTDAPTMAPSITASPTSYDEYSYYAFGRTTTTNQSGQTGMNQQDKAWIVTSALLIAGVACAALYKRFKKTSQKQQQAKIGNSEGLVAKGDVDGLGSSASETPYARSDLA